MLQKTQIFDGYTGVSCMFVLLSEKEGARSAGDSHVPEQNKIKIEFQKFPLSEMYISHCGFSGSSLVWLKTEYSINPRFVPTYSIC